MGNVQASKIKNMVGITNSFITNVTNSSSTENTGRSTNIQDFLIEIGPTGRVGTGCSLIDFSNSIISNQKIVTSSAFQSTTDIKNNLSNMVDQIAESSKDAVAEFLSLSGNTQLTEQELVTELKNSIENNITNLNATKCIAINENLQNKRLIVNGILECGPNGQLKAGQQIVNDQQSQCISNLFINAVSSGDIVNDIIQKAKTEDSAKTVGPIGAFFGSVGGIITVVIIAIFLILLIGGGIFAYKKYKGSIKSPLPSIKKIVPPSITKTTTSSLPSK